MNDELKEKTERIAAMLDREHLEAVLLNAQHNFAWLTGGGTSGIDVSRENGGASLLITRDGRRFILATNIEMPRMLAEEVAENDFEPVVLTWQSEKEGPGLIVDKARSVLKTAAAVATDLPIDIKTPAVEAKIAPCRYRLTNCEIERFRALGHDAGTAARRLIDKVSPGETEIEIAAKFRCELTAFNIDSVVTLIAADARISQFRHPLPTDNRWEKTLLIAICAKRHGLIASLSRMVCVDNIPEELRSRTESAAYVNTRLLAATRPGATGAELYTTAEKAYVERGFADEIDRHHQGGATGYKTREWVAHPQSAETVQKHQAFAWNPSITGTKVEETCIVGDDGVENITASPDFPQIAVTLDGREYFSPGILSL